MNRFLVKHYILYIMLSLFFSCTLLTHSVALATESADIIPVQILTINDFHGTLAENAKNPGAAKLAQYIKDKKKENPSGTLIVSAGDMFQGSPDSNLLYGKTVVEMMNAIGFDAMTIGNHEFDWGVAILKQRIAQSNFPYISANITDKSTGTLADFVKPYAIFERNGLKIAIIGLTTPETAYKASGKVVSAYQFEYPATIVNALVPKLKQQGVDIILVLSHLGSMMDQTTGKITGEAADLAMNTDGIDAIISGHSHQIVSGMVNHVPIVQASYWGRAVGTIDISYNKSTKKIVSSSASTAILPIQKLTADPQVKTILDQVQTETASIKNTILGRTIHELGHNRDVQEVSLLGQWTTDIMRSSTDADIAFQNAGGIRTNIAAGNITLGNLYEVFPFDNTLVTMEMTGAQIIKVLEHGIQNNTIGMVQFSGIKVVYDQDQIDNQRIHVTLLDDTPLDLTRTYKVVTNDFMAAGGDNFTMFKEGNKQTDTNIPLRDICVTLIKKLKTINFNGDNRFIKMKAFSLTTLPKVA